MDQRVKKDLATGVWRYLFSFIFLSLGLAGCDSNPGSNSSDSSTASGTPEEVIEQTWESFVAMEEGSFEDIQETLEELKAQWVETHGKEAAADMYKMLHKRLDVATAWQWRITLDSLQDGDNRERFKLKVWTDGKEKLVKFNREQRPALTFEWHPNESFAFTIEEDGPGPINPDLYRSKTFKGPLAMFQSGIVSNLPWKTPSHHKSISAEKAFKAKLTILPVNLEDN